LTPKQNPVVDVFSISSGIWLLPLLFPLPLRERIKVRGNHFTLILTFSPQGRRE